MGELKRKSRGGGGLTQHKSGGPRHDVPRDPRTAPPRPLSEPSWPEGPAPCRPAARGTPGGTHHRGNTKGDRNRALLACFRASWATQRALSLRREG